MSHPLRPHGLQHARLPCTSQSPGVRSNSCPLSWWCHPTILSSAAFFFPFQSLPASGSFSVSWLFSSGGHGTGVSASASVLPMIFMFFRIDWLDLLEVQGTLKSLLQHHSSKASILQHSAFFIVQLSYLYLTNGKTIAFTDLCQQSNASAFQYAV